MAEATATQLELARVGAPTTAGAGYDAAIAKYRALALHQSIKKNALNAIASSIAMLALTALTRWWALYWASLVPTVFGILMGVAGLGGLPIHPEFLVRLRS